MGKELTIEDQIFSTDKEREFNVTVDGKKTTLVIFQPKARDVMEADIKYRIGFSVAVRQKVITKGEAQKILNEGNFWSKEDDKVLDDLNTKLEASKLKLLDTKDRSIVEKIEELRQKINEQSSIKNDIFNNTAENAGEELRIRYLCTKMIKHKDTGDFFFKDEEDLEDRANEEYVPECLRQVILFNVRLKPDFEEHYFEKEWLKENEEEKPKETIEPKEETTEE